MKREYPYSLIGTVVMGSIKREDYYTGILIDNYHFVTSTAIFEKSKSKKVKRFVYEEKSYRVENYFISCLHVFINFNAATSPFYL